MYNLIQGVCAIKGKIAGNKYMYIFLFGCSSMFQVYLEVKLVPNLVYAARLLVRQSGVEHNSTER